MKDCEYYSELISRLIDDEVNADERAEIKEHIAHCSECRALYEAFASLSENISENLEEVPEGLTENIMADVSRSNLKAVTAHRTRVKKLIAAAAAVAALAVICLGLPKLGSSVVFTGSSSSAAECTEEAPDAARMAAAAPDAAEESAADAAPAEEYENSAVEDSATSAVSAAPEEDAANGAEVNAMFSMSSGAASVSTGSSPLIAEISDSGAEAYFTEMLDACETSDALPDEADCDAVIRLVLSDGRVLIVEESSGREYCAFEDEPGTVYVIPEGMEYFTEEILSNYR